MRNLFGPASVKNIISRVTGGSASWIDGKLVSTIPSASLHFLNPAGVMLGLNSSLDINGTFNLNTERYLKMSDAELLGSDISEDLYPHGIILDGTVGNAGKIGLQGPDYEIKTEYGRQVGANLFHSFEQFNILSGESAAFQEMIL
ncbi:MAG: filamentous hemagglutinin N-terminal domain-containing protein [Desulfobacteraceae bacterium]|nr:filamentous hemagglutinin N-terminal domain-containing protein [Desulfobacteraceae bacterium]